MKIIASVNGSNFIVEMSGDEIAQVSGKGRADELRYGGPYTKRTGLEVGTAYQVGEIYKRLRSQERVSAQLNQCAESLEALAALVRTTLPTAELVGEPKPTEAV